MKTKKYNVEKLLKESERRVLNEHEIYFLLERVLTSYMPTQQRSNWNPLRWFLGKDILRHQGSNTSMLHTGPDGRLYFDASHEYNPSVIEKKREIGRTYGGLHTPQALALYRSVDQPSSQGIDPNMDPETALRLIYGRPDKFQGAQRKALIQYFKDRQAEKVQAAQQQQANQANQLRQKQIDVTRKANEDHMADADFKNQKLLKTIKNWWNSGNQMIRSSLKSEGVQQKKLFNRYAKTLVESMSYEQVKDFIKANNISKGDILRANPEKGIDLRNPDHLELVNTYRLAKGLGRVELDPSSGEVISEPAPTQAKADFKTGLKNWQQAADILGDSSKNGGMSQVYGADDSLPYKDDSLFGYIGNSLHKLGRMFGGPNAVRHKFLANGQYDQEYVDRLANWATGAMKELGVIHPNEQPTPEAIHNFLTTWNTPVVKLADGTPITRLQLASAYKAGQLTKASYDALINQYENNATDKNGNKLPVYLSMGQKKTKTGYDNFGRLITMDDGTSNYEDLTGLDDPRLKNAVFTGNIVSPSGAPVNVGLDMQKSLKNWLGLTPTSSSQANNMQQATNLSDRTTRVDKNGNPIQVWVNSQGQFVQPNYGNTSMSNFTKQLNTILSDNTVDTNTKLTKAMDAIKKANVNDTYKERLQQLVYQRLGMVWDPGKERYMVPASRTHSVKNDPRFIKLKREYEAKLADLNTNQYPNPQTRGQEYRMRKNQLDRDYQAKVHKLRLATGRFTGATSQAMLTATSPSTTTAMTLTSENTYANAIGSLILAEAFMKRFVLNNVNFFSEITADEIDKAVVQANAEKKAEKAKPEDPTPQPSEPITGSNNVGQDANSGESPETDQVAQSQAQGNAAPPPPNQGQDDEGNWLANSVDWAQKTAHTMWRNHKKKNYRLQNPDLYAATQYAIHNPLSPEANDPTILSYLTTSEKKEIRASQAEWKAENPGQVAPWEFGRSRGTTGEPIAQDQGQATSSGSELIPQNLQGANGVPSISTSTSDSSKPDKIASILGTNFNAGDYDSWVVSYDKATGDPILHPAAEKYLREKLGLKKNANLKQDQRYKDIIAALKERNDTRTKQLSRGSRMFDGKDRRYQPDQSVYSIKKASSLATAVSNATNSTVTYDPDHNVLVFPLNNRGKGRQISLSDKYLYRLSKDADTGKWYLGRFKKETPKVLDKTFALSENTSNVLTYKQFTNRYREVVEKHSSEVSPKNMYQLYLLGKVKKLIK